jgi:hypothetical protein
MTKFRYHRGTLADSMATVIEVESFEELEALLHKTYNFTLMSVLPYVYDHRTQWHTYGVILDGDCVGMTNGPLNPHTNDT